MFCNGSWLDKGDLARPRVATITSRTSLEVFSSQPMVTDDIDGLIGPISCPPIPEVVYVLDGHKNMRRFAHYCTYICKYLIIYMYINK